MRNLFLLEYLYVQKISLELEMNCKINFEPEMFWKNLWSIHILFIVVKNESPYFIWFWKRRFGGAVGAHRFFFVDISPNMRTKFCKVLLMKLNICAVPRESIRKKIRNFTYFFWCGNLGSWMLDENIQIIHLLLGN